MRKEDDSPKVCLQRLLEGYAEHYEIRQEVRVGEYELPALAEYHSVQERTILGFRMKALAGSVSEAGEYVLFLAQPVFDPAAAGTMLGCALAGEQELVRPSERHAFTMLSVVSLARTVERDAAEKIRRYKRFVRYASGWGLVRLAVMDTQNRTAVWNRDGKDLARLLVTRLGWK